MQVIYLPASIEVRHKEVIECCQGVREERCWKLAQASQKKSNPAAATSHRVQNLDSSVFLDLIFKLSIKNLFPQMYCAPPIQAGYKQM